MTVTLSWYNENNIWVTGFIRSGSRYLSDSDLAGYFSSALTIAGFEQKLISANGQFSVVIRRDNEIWAAVDRVRNYPLFYMKAEEGWMISENCYELAALIPEKKIDHFAVNSFLATGFVIGNLTLIEDVFQVEAGSFVVLNDEAFSSFYHNSANDSIAEKSISQAKTELTDLIHEVFSCHFKALNNRFIAIPLSGGYDSRLVTAMCAKYHPENVICYTYGSKESPETAPAKEAAERAGMKWINIVYNKELIRDFMHDGYFEKYFTYASGLNSMFFLQEYFAVRYLKMKNLIPDNCVFMPGFTGDVLAGSHLTPKMSRTMTPMQTAKLIFREFFGLIKTGKKEKDAIADQITLNISPDLQYKWKAIESWDMKERQSKFIVNSAKIYKYFGYDYAIPFWDKSLIDFFSQLPFEFKLNKKLYDMVLIEEIFREQNLNLKNEISASTGMKWMQRVKERLKRFIPSYIIALFISRKSPIFYDEITRYLVEDFGQNRFKTPAQPNYYNSYITQWYLLRTKKDLGIIQDPR
jgi:asparagine synthase (glutamine-hydrolysing)